VPRRLVAALAALALAGCASGGTDCAEVPLSPEAANRLEVARPALGFDPVTPCSTVPGLRVEVVSVDGPTASPRLTHTVGANPAAFTFSESSGVSAFRQIPQGTSRISWTVSEVTVSGFEGTSFSGTPILYVQWTVDGRVYEFQASPRGRFTTAHARATARGNVRATVGSDP
jgi:hypothetical protein